jgi:hypothetical protein
MTERAATATRVVILLRPNDGRCAGNGADAARRWTSVRSDGCRMTVRA